MDFTFKTPDFLGYLEKVKGMTTMSWEFSLVTIRLSSVDTVPSHHLVSLLPLCPQL